jgi:hypothetical protein
MFAAIAIFLTIWSPVLLSLVGVGRRLGPRKSLELCAPAKRLWPRWRSGPRPR